MHMNAYCLIGFLLCFMRFQTYDHARSSLSSLYTKVTTTPKSIVIAADAIHNSIRKDIVLADKAVAFR